MAAPSPRGLSLRGPRLVLRDIGAGDEDAIHAFASDADLLRYTDWGPNTRADTAAYVQLAAASAKAQPRRDFELALTLPAPVGVAKSAPAAPRLVGTCALHRVGPGAQRGGELGYTIDPGHGGRGYATEATQLLLALAFGPLQLHRVIATCHPDNVGSVRVLRKAGFQQEGLLRQERLSHGSWRDSLLWAVLQTDPRPELAWVELGLDAAAGADPANRT